MKKVGQTTQCVGTSCSAKEQFGSGVEFQSVPMAPLAALKAEKL